MVLYRVFPRLSNQMKCSVYAAAARPAPPFCPSSPIPHFSACSQHARHIYGPYRDRECWVLKGNIEERACELAAYIIENRTTVREAARRFGISKSTVHKDIQERLPLYNRGLYLQVKEVLDENKAERHIRGGIATRRKYRGEP